jgi:hypothetical protein
MIQPARPRSVAPDEQDREGRAVRSGLLGPALAGSGLAQERKARLALDDEPF